MKISEEQKDKNRKKLIQAAVEVITEKGFQASTMREIAKEAGLAEATIYNYFPTKESLVWAYYELSQEKAIKKTRQVGKLEAFSLQEQFQLLMDASLEEMLAERSFVEETFSMAFLSPMAYFNSSIEMKKKFSEIIFEFIENAEKKGEIPQQMGKQMFPFLAWDYYLGVLMYWLKDRSENFSNTTILVDKSLAVVSATLKSGVISSGLEFLNFLYRSHVAKWLEGFASATGMAGKENPGQNKEHNKEKRSKSRKTKNEK